MQPISPPPLTNHDSQDGKRVRQKADHQTQALSIVMREISRRGEASRNQLASNLNGLKSDQVDLALSTLSSLKVLKTTKIVDRCKYSLRSLEDGGPKDFLILSSQKRVAVSSEGNRAVRVGSRLMALREKVTSRPCGSLIWSGKVSAPKYRLGPARRFDPVSGNDPLDPKFEIVKKENNDMAFRLNFDPPLFPGEVVEFGFYIWTQNYYCKSRKESLEKYHDEWTREGMSVNDPSLFLGIKVKLPEGYCYQQARVEKNPVLTKDGPNVPGAIVSTFKPGEKVLGFSQDKPDTGHYFVSWIPPE